MCDVEYCGLLVRDAVRWCLVLCVVACGCVLMGADVRVRDGACCWLVAVGCCVLVCAVVVCV